MIKNYLKTAFRSLWREKGSTFINITGLTLGITSSLILFLIITHYISFDNFHTKRDRIYRVVHHSKGNNGLDYSAGVPAVLPEAFKNDFTEAEEVVFTSYRAGSLISIPQANGELKKFNENNGLVFTQPTFFKIFDRKILMGDAQKGLDEPNEAIISEKSANLYFGKEDVIGETVIHNNIEYKITAVMEDFPSNTDFPFGLMLSYATIKKELDDHGWNSVWSDEQCYFLLKEGENIDKLEARVPEFVKKYYGDDNEDEFAYTFQPLKDLHFDDRYSNYTYNVTPRTVLVSLAVIAVFLIITACINFINLTTAEAIKRSKEVGIRKSLGSSRAQLVFQFLGESSLVTLVAVILSVAGTQLALIYLNPFLDLSLALNLATDVRIWFFLIAIIVVVSGLSGLYPSFVVSAFRPALALKNMSGVKNSSGYNLRRGLVVMQFFISQFFIIGTIVLIQQMDFFDKKDLGFSKEAIVNISIPVEEKPAYENEGVSKMRTLKNEILTISGVEKASLNNRPPSSGSVSGTGFKIEGKEENFGTQVKTIDDDYIDLFKMHLVAGQNIVDMDTATGFLVNEKLVKTVGYASNQEIIGKEIKMWGKRLPVVGVIKDFHTVSLSDAIEPVILLNRIRNYGNLSIKLNAADMQGVIKQVQQKWEAAYPDFIFGYEFLDDEIKGFYEGERKMSTMITIFASLAIVIGCLGLFGLATFMANQKTKEIGVRKVLGASVESIVILFSKEFVKLIVIGFLLAAPASWYVMNGYLDQFQYKITIGPMIFVTGIGVTFLIAMLTVGFKSFKAATINPAQSLKSE
jgi:putative ABC transport system permease protein